MEENNLWYGVSKAFLDKLAGEAAEKPAQTLAAAWDLIFGDFHTYVDKINWQRQQDFKNFKDSLLNEVEAIPEKNLQEPQLSLIGPALESTKFYIHDEELRDLFVNLISKSMDDRYNKEVNHAFVEIIKQMSPIDAYLIKKINTRVIPIARYKASYNKGNLTLSDYTLLDDIFNSQEIQVSINNLRRLGIVETPVFTSLTAASLYDEFLKTREYYEHQQNNDIAKLHQSVKTLLSAYNNDIDLAIEKTSNSRETIEDALSYTGVTLDKSTIKLTQFGSAFYNVCVS